MSKKKEINITEEDFNLLNDLQQKKNMFNAELINLGNIEIDLDNRKKNAAIFSGQIKDLEKSIQSKLDQVYGDGQFDLERKVFIPREKLL